MPVKEGKVVTYEAIVADLNVTFEWLDVPNVRTDVLDTVAFRHSGPAWVCWRLGQTALASTPLWSAVLHLGPSYACT